MNAASSSGSGAAGASVSGAGLAALLRGLDGCFRRADVDAHGDLAFGQTVEHRVGDEVAIELQSPRRVIVGRHRIGDADRIAVGVEDGNHGDVELARFLDRDVFLVGVDHEHQVGDAAHVLDAAEREFELVALARQLQQFLLGAAGLFTAAFEQAFQLAQTGDGAGNGPPVGERAAQPTVVHIILRATLGRDGDGVRRLALSADEQHPSAAGRDFAHLDQGLVEQRHGLRQVDDVDIGPRAEDVALHLRVPAVGLVAEVGAGFEKLPHGEFG
jgi:hypothetical protein